jgi:hypothetical protein
MYEYNLCGYDKAYLSIPDVLKYSVNTNSEAGIRSWNYKILQKDRLLDSAHNLNEPPNIALWKVADKFSNNFYNNPTQAKYIVTIYDNSGQSVADTSIININALNSELSAEISVFDRDKRRKLDSVLVEDLSSCTADTSLVYPDVFYVFPSTNSLGELSSWKLSIKDNSHSLFDTIGSGEIPKEIAFGRKKILNILPKASSMLSFQLEITDSRNHTCYSNIIKIPIIRNKYELKADLKVFEYNNNDTIQKEIPLKAISITERNSTRLQPLLNYVFFEENSAEIPKRYNKLQWQQAKEFTLDLLHETSIIETYYNVLNIIGKRLTMYPQAKINLVGCNSNIDNEKDNLELSKKRAEAIRDYLRDVWSISEDRIIITARNSPANPSLKQQKDPQDRLDAIAEDRRVEIYSDTYEVLDPVLTTGVRYEVSPNKAIIKPIVKK